MNAETLTPIGLEAALDHSTLELPVRYGPTPLDVVWLPVVREQLPTFNVLGHRIRAVSEAEAVGAVLMDERPDASCESLGLDCQRILAASMKAELPVRDAKGAVIESVSDLLDADPNMYGPDYLVVFKNVKPGTLVTDDENGDRIYVSARTVTEAVGLALLRNPKLCYDDVLDHMEA